MGLTSSFMFPRMQRNQPTYEYAPKPRKHKKSRPYTTELINPVESTNNETINTPNIKVEEYRQTIAVVEHYEKK